MSIVLLVITVVAVLLLLKSLTGSGQFSYRRKLYQPSKVECSFYGVLSRAVGFERPLFWGTGAQSRPVPRSGNGRPEPSISPTQVNSKLTILGCGDGAW
jgi:hypothetical protein